jgi:signal transduction histidine kinase
MFTAILGHDLRNPLGAIMTAAHLLSKRATDDKTKKPLSRILSSGDRMARMIDQLLDFTRARVGSGIPLLPRQTDLRPVLEQVIEELGAPNPETEIALEHAGDTAGTWDPDRLAQVFSNLVGNAVQHGRADGRVTVRLDGSERDRMRVVVHNAGIVPPERVKRLFEPMLGADRRGENSEGLGLGLFISREIARAHGGGIAAESSEAGGTSFTVTLPRKTT